MALTVIKSTGIDITGNYTVNGLNVSANLNSGNANLGNAAVANYFIGSGANLTSIAGANVSGAVGLATYASTANAVAGANVSGTVANANYATYSGTAYSVSGSNVSGEVANANYATYSGTAYSVSGANVSGAVAYATTANSVSGSNVSGAVAYATTANSVAGANVSGTVANANYATYSGTAYSVSGSNVSGTVANANYAAYAGNITIAGQSNITSVGTLSSLVVTGNISSGNANLGNLVTANYFSGDGYLISNISVSGNAIINGNSNVSVAANSNVTISVAGNTGIVTVTGTGVNVAGYINTNTANITSGNANLGNAVIANYFIGSGANLTSISGANVSGEVANANYATYSGTAYSITGSNVSGAVAYATTANSVSGSNVSGQVGNALIAATVYSSAQPNITSVGTLTDLSVFGNAVIGGNLTVSGTTTTVNSTTTRIIDPIVELGGGANGAALSTDDNKDRGHLLHYYSGSTTVDAFIGWDDSNAEFAVGSNVSVSSEVVTFNTLGNLRAGYFMGNGSQLTGIGSASSALTTTTLANGTSNVNVPVVDGNVTVSVAGNTNRLVITGTGINVAGTINSTGNLIAGNANLGNTANANYFYGNGIYLSGIDLLTVLGADQANYISNGTSNINTPIANGNITVGIGGVSNTVIFTTTGVNVAGNVTASNFFGNGYNLTGIARATSADSVANGTSNVNIPTINGNVTFGVAGNANVVTVTGTGLQTGSGTGGNISGANLITANYFIGSGGNLSNIQGANVSGNVSTATASYKLANGTSNVDIVASNGNVTVGVAGNTNRLVITGTGINVTGTINSTGNLIAANANLGNLVTANYFSGDGSLLNNISVSGNAIINGNSNVTVAANSNVTISISGTAGVVTVTGTGVNVAGYINTGTGNIISGNANLGNAVTANYFIGSGANLTSIAGANVSGTVGLATYATTANTVAGANVSGTVANANYAAYAGNITIAGQSNITSVGSLTGLTVSNASGIVDFTTTANVTLGAVANLHISGGSTNYILKTDGSGNLSWTPAPSGGSPGGSNTYVQFNDSGSFAGNANLVFDKTTGTLTTLYFSGAGNALSNVQASNITGTVANANYSAYAGNVTIAGQSNITSTGTLTSLTVGPNSSVILSGTSGYVKANSIQGIDGTAALYMYYGSVSGAAGIRTDLTVGTSGTGNLSIAGNITGTSGDLAITSYTNSNIALTANGTGRISLDGMRWPAADGAANYVLKTDGSNNLSWVAQSGGGGGGTSPAITDNTTTNATYYPVYATASSGDLTTAGIATTKLQFNPSTGQLTVQDLNSLSDATLKEDIQVIDDPFSILNSLAGVGFNWIDNGRKSYGLLAQAVEKVIPALVSENAQGNKTVNYIPIIAFLIEAVKKQQRDIEELKKDKYS